MSGLIQFAGATCPLPMMAMRLSVICLLFRIRYNQHRVLVLCLFVISTHWSHRVYARVQNTGYHRLVAALIPQKQRLEVDAVKMAVLADSTNPLVQRSMRCSSLLTLCNAAPAAFCFGQAQWDESVKETCTSHGLDHVVFRHA
jgi:hypothetical protein